MTATASTPLTNLQLVKDYLGIKTEGEDPLLQVMIDQKSAEIEDRCSRQFKLQSYSEAIDGLGEGDGLTKVMVSQSPLVSVTSLSVGGVAIPARTSVTGNGYVIDDNDVITLQGYTFDQGTKNILATYTAGYATIPADLQMAATYLVCLEYQRRKRIGISSEGTQGQTRSYEQDEPAWVTRTIENYSARS